MKKSVSSQVCDTILDDIFHNTYKPGQILTERSLIETYGVSKTTLREALVSLLKRIVSAPHINVSG